jgi:hypothetical protein
MIKEGGFCEIQTSISVPSPAPRPHRLPRPPFIRVVNVTGTEGDKRRGGEGGTRAEEVTGRGLVVKLSQKW